VSFARLICTDPLYLAAKSSGHILFSQLVHTAMQDKSGTKAPSVLVVCRESYSVPSKFYTPSLPFRIQSQKHTSTSRGTLYLRFNTFAMLPSGDWYAETMDKLECLYDSANLKSVQNLAVC
jgi:hypothetical protein